MPGGVISIRTVSTPAESVTVAFIVMFLPNPAGELSETPEIDGGSTSIVKLNVAFSHVPSMFFRTASFSSVAAA